LPGGKTWEAPEVLGAYPFRGRPGFAYVAAVQAERDWSKGGEMYFRCVLRLIPKQIAATEGPYSPKGHGLRLGDLEKPPVIPNIFFKIFYYMAEIIPNIQNK
jgi:hypothetical protein